MTPAKGRRSRIVLAAAAAVLVVVGAGTLFLALDAGSKGHGPGSLDPSAGSSTTITRASPQTGSPSDSSIATPSASTNTTVGLASPQPVSPSDSLIATLGAPTKSYTDPGGSPAGTIPPTWHSAVSALPVIATQSQWLEVRLAPRPNGSTAWIERSPAVVLTETPYRIVLDLASKHLELYRSGLPILDAPAGIGTSADPTPTGDYFLAFFARSPSSGYGPFVMVTSAHSNQITDWEQSGDGIIAIHGPLGADSDIGTTGSAISHGCIRLHDLDLEQLRDVPAGSPIDIVG